MKNKLILSFLIIPVIIACQNNNVNVSNSPEPSKSNIIPSVSPTNAITPTTTSTISIVLSPSPSITPTPSPTIDPDTFFVYSNMEKAKTENDYKYSPIPNTYGEVEVIKKNDDKMSYYSEFIKNESLSSPLYYIYLYGSVYDLDSKPVADANVEINNTKCEKDDEDYRDQYCLNSFNKIVKTDSEGKFKVKTPLEISLGFKVSKEGYTSRINNKLSRQIQDENSINFGGEVSGISKSPEIYQINVNNQRIRRYDRRKIYLSSEIQKDVFVQKVPVNLSLISKKTIYSKFKIISTNKITFDLYFNNSINKESLEANICLSIINKDRTESECFRAKNFNWSNDNKKVSFNIDLANQKEDKKYRLKFEKPFIDSLGNLAKENMYLANDEYNHNFFTELSENIVFEIEGEK